MVIESKIVFFLWNIVCKFVIIIKTYVFKTGVHILSNDTST
jgi:hypothetical protein